jgi:glycosyltransferase involved in cell wall biosynthesis
MRFSIIVTVYNTSGSYLRECIDSVLNQTHQDVEIIIVDDGSSAADTLSVLEEYEHNARYDGKTLIVRHKPNGGQGSARNAGMSLATGDYWLFLDSDDYYMLDTFLEEMSELLEESHADMCSFQYAEFFSDGARPRVAIGDLQREKVYNQPADIAAKALLSAPRKVFSGVTHTKALKGSFMREHGIVAPEGLKNEDNSLSAEILYHAKTFDRYNKAVYGYRRANANSLTTQTNNSFKIAHDILTQFQILLSDKDYAGNRNVLDFLASPYVYWMSKLVSASLDADSDRKAEIAADIKIGTKFAYALRYSSRPYIRCVGWFVRVFGMRFTMFLLRIYLTLNRRHMLSINRKTT